VSNVLSDAPGALDPELSDLIDRLPKVELHVHLEGTLEPELALHLAARNGVALPFGSFEEIRAAYEFSDLQSFLDVYYAACTVLVTREDFFDLTRAYLARAHADGVRHVEPFFDPQTHTERGIPIGEVVGGILDGLAEGERLYGITSGLILSFLRHLPVEAADAALAAAEPWLDRIVAVGLDSSEIGFPPEPFAGTFARARSLGLRAVAHAGEEGDASLVSRTIDALGGIADRPWRPGRGRLGRDAPPGRIRSHADGLPEFERAAACLPDDGAVDHRDALTGRRGGDDQLGRPGLFRGLHRRQLPGDHRGARVEGRGSRPAGGQRHHRFIRHGGTQARASGGAGAGDRALTRWCRDLHA